MAESFGARLREQREREGVSLRAIADQTKIKLSLLEGLEAGDVSRWPGGIFRRAFVRAYAQAIGLDPDAVVREFLELYPDPGEEIATAVLVDNRDESRRQSGWRSAIRKLVSRPRSSAAVEIGGDPMRIDRAATADDCAQAAAAVEDFGRVDPIEPIEDLTPADASRELTQAEPIEELVPPDLADATAVDAGFADADFTSGVPAEFGPIEEDPLASSLSSDAAEPDLVASAPEAPSQTAEPEMLPPPGSDEPEQPDLAAVARLCTALARVEEPRQVLPLLEEAADVLDAAGLIVWMWDPDAQTLRATLAHGYSPRVLAQLPEIESGADNATAAAFRLAQTCVVHGVEGSNGALAVPLEIAQGCGGVLGIELRHGRERTESARAVAAILAAQLAAMIRPAGSGAEQDIRLNTPRTTAASGRA